MFKPSCLLAIAILLFVGGWSSAVLAAELIYYQAPDWRYAQYPFEPANWAQLSCDDPAFELGRAAFGSPSGCPLDTTIYTDWQSVYLVLCKVFFITDDSQPVTVYFAVDNDARIAINGHPLSDWLLHDDCPMLDDFTLTVPSGLIVPGSNQITILARDRGTQPKSYFDIRVEGDAPTGGLASTWGQLKMRYR